MLSMRRQSLFRLSVGVLNSKDCQYGAYRFTEPGPDPGVPASFPVPGGV